MERVGLRLRVGLRRRGTKPVGFLILIFLLIVIASQVLRLRDQCGAENEKPSDPGKTENEGIRRIPPKTDRETGLILLFVGEVGRIVGCGHDERRPTGILTSGLNLVPVFPIHLRDQ